MVHEKLKADPAVSQVGKEVSESEVLRQIENAKQYLQANKDVIAERVYDAMDGFSRSVLGLQGTGAGWAKEATTAAGDVLWPEASAEVVEAALPIAIQAGGAFSVKGITLKADSQLIQPLGEMPTISLDGIFKQVKDYLASIDEKNRELAAAIGPVALVNKMDRDPGFGPILPYMPFRVQIPARSILPMLNGVLESIRLMVTVGRFQNDTLRKLLSIVLSILDVSRGEWRDGVMSLLGVFSSQGSLVGVVGKTFRWVYNFISPDIQERIEDDLYAGGKSMFVGFWLWLLSVASPDFVRATINNLLETANKQIGKLEENVSEIQQKAIASGEAQGLQVTFPEFPLKRLPSFDDIQNFQSILHRPEVQCSAEFQAVLQPALAIPPIRILLELLNFPTLPEDLQKVCAGRPSTVSESLAESMTPMIMPKPEEIVTVKEEVKVEEPEVKEPEVKKPEVKKGGTRRRSRRPSNKRNMPTPVHAA